MEVCGLVEAFGKFVSEARVGVVAFSASLYSHDLLMETLENREAGKLLSKVEGAIRWQKEVKNP